MRFAVLDNYLRSGSSTALPASAAPWAEDRYFMLIFAAQGIRFLPQCAHTFATFVRAAGEHAFDLECQTISWLPANLDIKILRLWPEPGRNFSLAETIAIAQAKDASLMLWGPYAIKKELYDRATRQVERLRAGQVQYKAIDFGFRPETATNCFHAVSDLDTDFGLLRTGTAFGASASAMVAQHLQRWVMEPGEIHPWLIDRLGLDRTVIEIQQLSGAGCEYPEGVRS